MTIVPFGPWRPDSAQVSVPAVVDARNVVAVASGYKPFNDLSPATEAVPGTVLGAGVALTDSGGGVTFAGTQTGLFRLAADGSWTDVTRTAGGTYGTPAGERWRFAQFGGLAIATNFNDDVQKLDPNTGGQFQALGGTPFRARYITVIGDFVVIANLFDQASLSARASRVQWSDIGDAEGWEAGTGLADFQDFESGGPIQQIIGGELGYVFQRRAITRMTFVPGSPAIFQFDEVERDRGLAAPNALIRVGRDVFYLGLDGFYRFDVGSGRSLSIGAEKVDRFFLSDRRPGTDTSVLGAADPLNHLAIWAYVSRDNPGAVPDRCIIYNWAIGEWSLADTATVAFVDFITQGQTLEDLDEFGALDTLAFSLDSPFWAGGNTILGVFGPDGRLSHFTGGSLPATLETTDYQNIPAGRAYVSGVRPLIDTDRASVRIGVRERLGDPVSFGPASAMESTGECPVHRSGRYNRLRLEVPANATWTLTEGFEPIVSADGAI